jgi:hypothetical protein
MKGTSRLQGRRVSASTAFLLGRPHGRYPSATPLWTKLDICKLVIRKFSSLSFAHKVLLLHSSYQKSLHFFRVSPILPFALPQRWAVRCLPRAWRGPQAARASASIIQAKRLNPCRQAEPLEARQQARQSLSLQRSRRDRGGCGKFVHGVALLSWNQHPEPTGSRRATPLFLFQH